MTPPALPKPGRCVTQSKLSVFLCVACLLGSLSNQFLIRAQDANPLPAANDAAQIDDTSTNDVSAADALLDDEISTNSVSSTNQAVPTPDARTRRNRRRAQNRSRESANRDSRPSSNDTNASTSSLDYSAFRLITDRNIFDPNRSPRSKGPAVQTKTTDSFTLVGTMSYEKGIFAFFDGTSSDYKKALKTNDAIANYKITSVSNDFITLAQGTNSLQLAVGTQMRRREDGTWEKRAGSEAYAATSSSNTASQTPPSGADNDVLKKLMMRREKE